MPTDADLRQSAQSLEGLTAEDIFSSQRVERTAVAPAPFGATNMLIGRDGELAQLHALAHRVAAHRTATTAVLQGPPGAGKTRLLREFCATLPGRDTWRIFTAAAREDGRPWAPISSWLATWAGISGDQGLDVNQGRLLAACSELLPAHLVTESAHLVAYALDLPFAQSPIVTPLVEQPQTLHSRLFMAIRRIFVALAQRQPLLLCGDHVETMTDETSRLVRYLMNGLSQQPVLLVFATRDVVTLDLATGDETQVETVDLGAMPARAISELLAELCQGLPAVPAAAIHTVRALGATPRAATEFVRLLAEAGCLRRAEAPATDAHPAVTNALDVAALEAMPLVAMAAAGHPVVYQDLVRARLAVMEPDVRAVLERASLLGDMCWVDAMIALGRSGYVHAEAPDGPPLASLLQTQDQIAVATLRALDRLTDGQWLVYADRSTVPGEVSMLFSNPELRETIYQAIDPTLGQEYHRVTAQWLQLTPSSRNMGLHAEIARHWVAANRPIEAAQAFRRAGDWARDQFANHVALETYQQALRYLGDRDLSTRLHVWHEVGGLYERIGDLDAALGGFERMLRLAWIAASKVKAAVAFNRMGRIWRRRAEVRLAANYLDRAAELFRRAGDVRGIATSLDDLGRLLHLQGRYDEAERYLTEALALRQQVGDVRSVATSLAALGALAEDRGELAQAQAHYHDASERQRAANDTLGALRSQLALAAIATKFADPHQARAAWQQALAEARDLGVVASVGYALFGLGELALRTGASEEAHRHLSEALAVAADIDEAELEAQCRRALAETQLRYGNITEAAALAEASLAQARSGRMRHLEARALVVLANTLSANLFDPEKTSVSDMTAPPRAAALYQDAIAIWRELGNTAELAAALVEFGRYGVERGLPADAVRALNEALGLIPAYAPALRAQATQLLRTLSAL